MVESEISTVLSYYLHKMISHKIHIKLYVIPLFGMITNTYIGSWPGYHLLTIDINLKLLLMIMTFGNFKSFLTLSESQTETFISRVVFNETLLKQP